MLALPDKSLWIKHNYIAGCDEAGRGPLAGPVVAAAVILPRNFEDPQIDDSKKLTAVQREKLFKVIIRSAVSFSFGIVDHETIDRINILNATKKAMYQAVISLSPRPEVVLIDAVRIPNLPEEYVQIPLIKGDTLSISIAAASILAKVRRDAIMREYHEKYPQYHFDQHKGYPTRLHRSCIKKHGPCPIHRKTFKLL